MFSTLHNKSKVGVKSIYFLLGGISYGLAQFLLTILL